MRLQGSFDAPVRPGVGQRPQVVKQRRNALPFEEDPTVWDLDPNVLADDDRDMREYCRRAVAEH